MSDNDKDRMLHSFFRSSTVEGINLTDALNRFTNSTTLLNFFQVFAVNSPLMLDELRSPNAENLPKYAIIVHSLKGVCYSISAENSGHMAKELEKNAEAGNLQFVLEKNDAFIASVEKILAGIDRLLVNAEKVLDKPKRNTPDPALLKQIAEAAGTYQVGKIDKAMYELEKYQYESHADLIVWLRERISLSDFEKIQEELLKKLKENT
jgi:HPt (histidine-containing phosphotransfer) domain-containing protein